MSKHIFSAEPAIKITVESEKDLSRLDASQVGRFVLDLHVRNLLTPIDTTGEDITDGKEKSCEGEERPEQEGDGGAQSEQAPIKASTAEPKRLKG
jgi:hypothetical protein